MVTVSKSTLKGKMLEYFRQVEETGEELVVTDNGRPVVKGSRSGLGGLLQSCSATREAGWSTTRMCSPRRSTNPPLCGRDLHLVTARAGAVAALAFAGVPGYPSLDG